jgi:hydroxylysine kinase
MVFDTLTPQLVAIETASQHWQPSPMSSTPRSQPQAKSKIQSVLEARAPAFSTREAEALAQRAFDIEASVHPLNSERDQNFRLRAKDGSEWVLKIANPAESTEVLDLQTRAMLHIAEVDPSLPIPRVKATPDGALFHQIDAPDGRCLMIP